MSPSLQNMSDGKKAQKKAKVLSLPPADNERLLLTKSGFFLFFKFWYLANIRSELCFNRPEATGIVPLVDEQRRRGMIATKGLQS